MEGKRFNEFGGFTSCYVLKKKDYALVIDCGTGLYEANAIVLDCPVIDVVITHMHYDHILGMLDWTAIPSKSKVTFYGGFDKWFGEETFKEFFREPFWPVQPNFVIKNTPQSEPLVLRDDLSVRFYPAPHPNHSQMMIISSADEKGNERKIAIMFDCEDSSSLSPEVLDNCDYILYDGMYTDAEYMDRKGFGHSTWQEGCRLASRVNPKKLIITHHDPNRSDDDLRKFERLARDIYPSCDFARSAQSWSFPADDDRLHKNKKEKKTKAKSLIERIDSKLDEIVLDDEKRLKITSLGAYIILCVVSLFMTVVNYFTDMKLLMYSTLIFAIACGIDIFLEIVLKLDYSVVQLIFQVEALLLFTFFIISGVPEGFAVLWTLMLPFGGMLVFGQKRTTTLCGIMMVIIVFFFYTPLGRAYLNYDYTQSFMLRFPMIFMASYLVALFLEIVRAHTFAELIKLRRSQEITIADQTSELREQNFNMLRINSTLELRNKVLSQTLGENFTDDQIRDLLKEYEPDESRAE